MRTSEVCLNTLFIRVRRIAPLEPEPTMPETGSWLAYSGDYGTRGRTPTEAIGELILTLAGVESIPSVEVLVEGLRDHPVFAVKGGAA